MNTIIAGLVALSCSEPSLSFKEFYARYVHRHAGVGESWMGDRGEATSTVTARVLDAQADWLEYRVERIEKCSASAR